MIRNLKSELNNIVSKNKNRSKISVVSQRPLLNCGADVQHGEVKMCHWLEIFGLILAGFITSSS